MRMITKAEFKQWQALPALNFDSAPVGRDRVIVPGHHPSRGMICGQLRPSTAQAPGMHGAGERISHSDRMDPPPNLSRSSDD